MANLAASAVTVNSFWTNGGVNGKRNVVKNVALVLTGQGGTTNKILATALGLTKVLACSNFVVSDNSKVYVAAPAADGSFIVLSDLTQGTDANRANPADITATLVGTIEGY